MPVQNRKSPSPPHPHPTPRGAAELPMRLRGAGEFGTAFFICGALSKANGPELPNDFEFRAFQGKDDESSCVGFGAVGCAEGAALGQAAGI